MRFNKHSNLEGAHAFLSGSKYHWIYYDDNKIAESYRKANAVEMGTRLHALASELINLGIKLPKSNSITLNMFVNDCIGHRMTSEQPLYFSELCFGTADAISFNEKTNLLRIFDLKTGETPAHMEQLEIYAALFCLEYNKKPRDIDIELRIYQSGEIIKHTPDADKINDIIDRIITADKIIRHIKEDN